MKLSAVPAFFRLVRWPNLLFISLTQSLFYFCIVIPSFYLGHPQHENILKPNDFILLSLSSVLIAAAGYIINDYFDLNIDQVNKPGNIIIQKFIKRRWAIFWHLSLSFAGVLITFIISWKIGKWIIGVVNLATVFLLLFYSTTF